MRESLELFFVFFFFLGTSEYVAVCIYAYAMFPLRPFHDRDSVHTLLHAIPIQMVK